MTPTPENLATLLDLLALTYAVFAHPRTDTSPARCLPNSVWVARHERISRYFERGLDYTGGGLAADRKAFERHVEDLRAQRLVKTFHRGGRRCGLRLTHRGFEIARFLVTEKSIGEVWPLLARMQLLVAEGVSLHCLVREDDLGRFDLGCEASRRPMLDLEADLLPLKVRGLVEDTADSHGRVYLSLTDAGKVAATQDPPKPTELPEYIPGLWEDYLPRELEYLRERMSWTPEATSAVVIAVGCGEGPARSWREMEGLGAPPEGLIEYDETSKQWIEFQKEHNLEPETAAETDPRQKLYAQIRALHESPAGTTAST